MHGAEFGTAQDKPICSCCTNNRSKIVDPESTSLIPGWTGRRNAVKYAGGYPKSVLAGGVVVIADNGPVVVNAVGLSGIGAGKLKLGKLAVENQVSVACAGRGIQKRTHNGSVVIDV